MPPLSKDAQQRIRDRRREQILEAAARVFARKGLAATKIADIAAAADVSHGLAYRYFASKDEIFAILVDRAMQSTEMLAEGMLARGDTPLGKLRWMTEQMLEGMQEDPHYFLLVLQALTSAEVPAETRKIVVRRGNVVYGAVRRVIVEGQQLGEIVAGDPDELAGLFLASIQGLAARAGWVDADQQLPAADTVLRILRA